MHFHLCQTTGVGHSCEFKKKKNKQPLNLQFPNSDTKFQLVNVLNLLKLPNLFKLSKLVQYISANSNANVLNVFKLV